MALHAGGLQPARSCDTETAMPNHEQIAPGTPQPSLVTLTNAVYALHAVSLIVGAFGAATIIGSFLFGWPSIIAVIINYVKRGDARGTYLESHFRWQIHTFWYALLWAVLAGAISLLLAPVLIGFVTWPVLIFALGVWAIYRIARGWLALRDGKPMAEALR
jgi:uncharacterized membrane protein